MVAALFVSCRNSVQGGNIPSGADDGYAYISINVKPAGRSAIVEKDSDLIKKLNEIVLTGIREGEAESIELLAPDPDTTFDELAEQISGIKIQTGTWSFTFSARLEGVLFSGTINSQKIVTGNNTLSFTLAPETNRGGFSIKLEITKSPVQASMADEVLEKVVATLENTDDLTVETITKVFDFAGENGNGKILTHDDDDEISTSGYGITYTRQACDDKENLDPGTYRLTFDVYTKGTVNPKGDLIPLNSVSFIVNITAGFNSYINNSSKAESMILGSTYKITYNLNDNDSDVKAEFVDDIIPEFYSYKTPEITLPALTRQGYEFLGWWFRGAKITKLDPSTNPGNVTLYAKWLRYADASGEIITEDGLLDITVDMPDKIYRNAGTFTFEAKLKGSEIEPASDAVYWNAMIIYKGVSVDGLYKGDPFTSRTNNSLKITNPLPVSGNYQLYVMASLKDDSFGNEYIGSTTSRIYDFEVPENDYLFEINNSYGDEYDAFKQSIAKVFNKSNGNTVNIKLTGNTGNKSNGLAANDLVLKDIGQIMKDNTPCETELDLSDLGGITSINSNTSDFPARSYFAYTKLNKLILPKSLETLKEYSLNCYIFDDVTENYVFNLEYVEIPDTIETIEDNAFGSTNIIKKFTIYQAGETPNNNCACKVLNNGIILTNTVTKNVNNTDVTITSVVAAAKNSELESIDFSDDEHKSITRITANAFASMRNIKSVNLGNVTEVGEYAFVGTGLSDGIVFNEDNTINIGQMAFAYTGLTSVSLPKNISFTPTEVDPDNIDPSDYNGAFNNCGNLKTVTIASGLTNDIDFSIFYRDSNIEEFVIEGEDNGAYSTICNGAFLIKEYTPQGSQTPVKTIVCAAQKGIPSTVDFSSEASEDITEIEPYALESNQGTEYANRNQFSVTSFGNITKIGEYAFSGSGITAISDFGNAKSFGRYAFWATPLASIPAVTEGMQIGSFAFAVTELTELTIGSPKITIDGSAFLPNADEDSNEITKVTLDFVIDADDTTDYSQYLPSNYDRGDDTKPYSRDYYISRNILCSWCGFTDVKELVFNKTVNLRDYEHKYNNDYNTYYYLTTETMTVNGSEIEYHIERPFVNLCDENGNSTLESITFNGENSVIGSYQFHSFNKLKTVTFSGNGTKINTNAFTAREMADRSSISLTSIDLTGVSVIGENALYNCLGGINNLIIPESVIAIGAYAIGDNESLYSKTITVEGDGTWYCTASNSSEYYEIWQSWISSTTNPATSDEVNITDHNMEYYLKESPAAYYFRK